MHIHELLSYAAQNKASDLHLSAGESPMLRINGEVIRINAPPLTPEDAKRLVYSVMNERQKAYVEEHLEMDFSIALKGLARFRVNVFNHTRGMGAVFRLIPFQIIPLKELGLSSVIQEFARYHQGLVLVTGPTGSGKTTTIASLIDLINETRHCHIITIEDPVEFYHKPKKSLINQRELSTHTKSFSNALRSALREDPDVILIGELRDLETISLALTAAETGHLVFATLHTRSASDTVARIIDVFPPAQQEQVRSMVAESLRAVVCQTLIRTRDGKGRTCAHEILVNNIAAKNLIRENKLFQIPSLMQTSSHAGMLLMEQSLKELVLKGRITRESALDVSGNPNMFAGESERKITRSTLS